MAAARRGRMANLRMEVAVAARHGRVANFLEGLLVVVPRWRLAGVAVARWSNRRLVPWGCDGSMPGQSRGLDGRWPSIARRLLRPRWAASTGWMPIVQMPIGNSPAAAARLRPNGGNSCAVRRPTAPPIAMLVPSDAILLAR